MVGNSLNGMLIVTQRFFLYRQFKSAAQSVMQEPFYSAVLSQL